jgi:hypothetical protein
MDIADIEMDVTDQEIIEMPEQLEIAGTTLANSPLLISVPPVTPTPAMIIQTFNQKVQELMELADGKTFFSMMFADEIVGDDEVMLNYLLRFVGEQYCIEHELKYGLKYVYIFVVPVLCCIFCYIIGSGVVIVVVYVEQSCVIFLNKMCVLSINLYYN